MPDPSRRYGDRAVAIIGMSGAYPGGRDLDAFRQMLRSGGNGVERVSDDELRYARVPPSLSRQTHYVRACTPLVDHDGFDAAFFGIPSSEARTTDPQHRLFLQHSYLALEQAGYASERGALSIGVFGGVGVPSTMIELARRGADRAAATTLMPLLIGTDKDYVATAVAYRLDLHGPAMTVQTACSTSLVAVHVAAQSLLAGECDLALAGGASVRVPHRVGYLFQDGGILSRDGYCRSFDESATGTIFGSGVGIVALRRLDEALAAGDPIRAVILGTAVNNDGARKVGFAAPSIDGQVAVISEALELAGLDPDGIDYVEAHGTGTRVGDAIEATALARVFASRSRGRPPCLIGSVKSNIGHVEAAAGVAALTKTVLALEDRWLPPSLFVERPIAEIGLGGALEIAVTGRPWPRRSDMGVAGVSSFGIGGTNAHVIVASPPERRRPPSRSSWHVARLSARTAPALAALAGRTAEWIARHPGVDAATVAASLDHGRPHHGHRAGFVFQAVETLSTQLSAFATQPASNGRAALDAAPGVAWMFGGQGAALRGAGAGLYAESQVVAQAIDEAQALLDAEFDVPVHGILVEGTTEPCEPQIVQPVTIALQIALARFWQERRLEPSAILGHGIGEIAAAVAAGALEWRSALRFAALRGQVMARHGAPGAVLAVEAASSHLGRVLAGAGLTDIAIAAIDGPAATRLAAAPDRIALARRVLAEAGMTSVVLNASRADHSTMMDPALAGIAEAAGVLRGVAGRPATLISTVTGGVVTPDTLLDPRHWQRHARETVLFDAAFRCACAIGVRHILEIGAEPQLGAHAGSTVPWVSVWQTLTARDKTPRPALDAAVGLYAAGVDLDVVAADRRRPRVAISGYAFDLERYGLDDAAAVHDAANLGRTWTMSAGTRTQPYLADHRIAGRIVVPGALFVEWATVIGRELLGEATAVSDVVFDQSLSLADDETVELRFGTVAAGPSAAIFSIEAVLDHRPLPIARGRIAMAEDRGPALEREGPNAGAPVPADRFYTLLARSGLDYGPSFRGISSLRCDSRSATAEIRVPPGLGEELDRHVFHPAVLDSCLHVAGAILALPARTIQGYLPAEIRAFHVFRSPRADGVLTVVAERRPGTDEAPTFDILMSDAHGPVARVDGLLLRRTRAPSAGWQSGAAAFHRLRWQEAVPVLSCVGTMRLIAQADDPLVAPLAAALRQRGVQVAVTDAAAPLRNGVVPQRVAYLGPLPSDRADADHAGRLWQACAPALDGAARPVGSETTGFCIVTRGATAPFGEPREPDNAGLWACGSSMLSERPDLRIRLIDVRPDIDPSSVAILADALLDDGAENRSVVRDGRWLVPRLEAFEPAACPSPPSRGGLRLKTERPGDLDALGYGPMPTPEPGRSEVRVRVEAASLNFLDVLAALGQRPDLPQGPCLFLGSECAGIVEAIGADVRTLAVGDRVVGIVPGAIATEVLAEAADLHPYTGLTAQQACAVPVCYGTAEYALRVIARLRAGESVLIHAASGGVGMAAIAVARSLGARVLATAGSDEKRDALRRMGLSDLFDSRSPRFVEGVLETTGGRGVDVVLNTLTEPLFQHGLSVLSVFGRFVDLSKRHLSEGGSLALGPFRRNLTYTAFDLALPRRERPDEFRALIADVLEQVAMGVYPVPPLTIFPAARTIEAFRLMARARHVGKIVIDVSAPPPRAETCDFTTFRPDGVYVVTGGLGALGIAIAARLAVGGARHLALLGRSPPSPRAEARLAELRAAGCTVTVLAIDVTQATAVEVALSELSASRPIRGVVHAAGILDDAAIADVDRARFDRVVAPKVRGLQALAAALRSTELDFLIVFSSASVLFSPPRQTAYAAANAAMEAIAAGVGARVIQWGAWAGGGMASVSGANDLADTLGLPPLLAEDGADAFARFVSSDLDTCAIFSTNPDRLGRGAALLGAGPLLEDIVGRTTRAPSSALLSALASHETRDGRLRALTAYLASELATLLGTSVEHILSLSDLSTSGIDSLMGIELAERLERDLGKPVNTTVFTQHRTIAEAAEVIAGSIALV